MRILLLILLLGQSVIWPTDDWQESTPEAQGVDAATLVELMHYINAQDISVDSLLIVRHGYLIFEAYSQGYDRDTQHALFSATKSFTGALVGIAIDEGYIESIDQPVVDFFEPAQIPAGDQTIVIEHVLTMTSGLDCRGLTAEAYLNQSPRETPGQRFFYCNGNSQILSSIIHAATGQTLADYADEKLFVPLGITDFQWLTRDGETRGAAGLSLKPRDMAKFAYLYLHHGRWENQQILPAAWITEMTSAHVEPFYPTVPTDWQYGYQMWVTDWGYLAWGWGNQWIWVVPELDIVGVVTATILDYRETDILNTAFTEYVLKSVVSDDALPENPEANQTLKMLVDQFSHR